MDDRTREQVRKAVMERSAEDFRMVADLYRELADVIERAGHLDSCDERIHTLGSIQHLGQTATAGLVGLLGCGLATVSDGTNSIIAAVGSDGRSLMTAGIKVGGGEDDDDGEDGDGP